MFRPTHRRYPLSPIELISHPGLMSLQKLNPIRPCAARGENDLYAVSIDSDPKTLGRFRSK